MTRCIWIGCEDQAWSDGAERSHFCIDHAWRAATRGGWPSHFLPNDAQRARMATFPDALSNRAYFPLNYIVKMESRRLRTALNHRWPCRGCDKIIISTVKYCGECRTRLGLEEDEPYQIVCDNFGPTGPGRYLNNECKRYVPPGSAFRPEGTEHTYCPPCWIKLDHMGEEWRKREGFDW